MSRIIPQDAIDRRTYWIAEIKNLSGNFADDALRLQAELENEINEHGAERLMNHIRLCGNIPEEYAHDSSEEKLYSKYTDCLIAFAFREIGLDCVVLEERANSADVLGKADGYSFVADAKAFRVSRTAKNQKDFKIEALNGWRGDNDYAMVVCPIYQLPTRASQIYGSATSKNVCIFTYSHLALLVKYATLPENDAVGLLTKIFDTVSNLGTSENAIEYWEAVNKVIFEFDDRIPALWEIEEKAAKESTSIAKSEGLSLLDSEKNRINNLTKEQAIEELKSALKLDGKATTIRRVTDSGLFKIGVTVEDEGLFKQNN